MHKRRELITISRQIGSMMEAGVDILRITRVLRAQTDDAELLRGFDILDHNLRMGQGLSDAMEQVPLMFSPFAISLVRQGEARNDIAGAFHKIADFLQKEDEADVLHESNPPRETLPQQTSATVTPSTLLPVWVIDDLINRAQVAALRIFTLSAGLLLSLAAVWGSVEAGYVERRWQNVVLCSVAALFIGGAGVWLRRRIDADRKREIEQRKQLEAQATQAINEKPASMVMPASAAVPTTAPTPRKTPREATFE
jgi:hypothetical protein